MVSELEPGQAEQLVALFAREWWTKDRDLEGVNRMLAGSTEVAGVLDGDELIAFGRAISDGVYRASINDIVVAAHRRRGEGLGAAVDPRAAEAPEGRLERPRRPALPRRHGPFYEALGFRRSDRKIHRMEIGEKIG